VTVDVRCTGVSKRYRVPRPRPAGGSLRSRLWPAHDEFWALRDLHFDVARGEALGIIGRNGAGKSTVLKLLSGITAPTSGEITIRGRLAALIEIGSGFHPELTGRENAYLSGSILGLRRREITERLPGIAEFAGIGSFLDVPVKFYSSGMHVRLGFAIAAHLEPDVLLVDEVLAVGDAEFQSRCLRRIGELKRRGVTMILVSHDLGAIDQLCDHALLLDHGTVAASGPAGEIVSMYQRLAAGADLAAIAAPHEAADGAPLQVRALQLLDPDRRSILTIRSGDPLVAEVTVAAERPDPDVEVTLSIYDYEHGVLLVECSNRADATPWRVPRGESSIEFVIPELLLGQGVYTVGVTVRPAGAPHPVAWRFGRTTLYVEGSGAQRGLLNLPYHCRTSRAADAPAGLHPDYAGTTRLSGR
jgi:ABC-type polysaccharide/polyol phosphate transport system ATPase subunit